MDDLLAAQQEFEKAISSHGKSGDEKVISDAIDAFRNLKKAETENIVMTIVNQENERLLKETEAEVLSKNKKIQEIEKQKEQERLAA